MTVRCDSRIAECNFGTWSGRTLEDVYASDPDAVARWMSDPSYAQHGGESLASVVERVGAWIDALDGSERVVVAITHGEVVKSAVVHALRAPLTAFWQMDVDPLSITELSSYDGRWTLARANCANASVG